jgi:hypothetical protein
MKTKPRSWKIVVLFALIVGVITAITFAQKPTRQQPSEHGIRLIFACNGKEPLHVTRASFDAALAKLPWGDDQCNVEYKSIKNPEQNTKKGKLKLVSCKDVDTGGAMTPAPLGLAAGGGVNVTQQVSFQDVGQLQNFTSNLVSEEP